MSPGTFVLSWIALRAVKYSSRVQPARRVIPPLEEFLVDDERHGVGTDGDAELFAVRLTDRQNALEVVP
ncbi:hypothetical protein GCM10020256_64460 [Streptomyces thermocoprophilus]